MHIVTAIPPARQDLYFTVSDIHSIPVPHAQANYIARYELES